MTDFTVDDVLSGGLVGRALAAHAAKLKKDRADLDRVYSALINEICVFLMHELSVPEADCVALTWRRGVEGSNPSAEFTLDGVKMRGFFKATTFKLTQDTSFESDDLKMQVYRPNADGGVLARWRDFDSLAKLGEYIA